jgi:AhpC/TSA family
MAAPKVQALADAGVRVVAVGEDPPPLIESYADEYGQKVPTLTEAPPYPASEAFGIDTVPTLFLVDEDGTVRDAVVSWDRDGWNRLAEAAGAPPVSDEGDGLPPFRPG